MAPDPGPQKNDAPPTIEGHGLRPAAAAVAAVAALAAPTEGPARDWKLDKIDQLQSVFDAEVADNSRLRKRTEELAADRDKWKLRAERAEKAGDGLALEKVTQERNGLKQEVSRLTKRIFEVTREQEKEIIALKDSLKASNSTTADLTNQAHRARTNMEQAFKARDTAVAAKETAEQERLEVVKRIADLEGQVKALKEKLQPPAVKAAGAPPAKVAASR